MTEARFGRSGESVTRRLVLGLVITMVLASLIGVLAMWRVTSALTGTNAALSPLMLSTTAVLLSTLFLALGVTAALVRRAWTKPIARLNEITARLSDGDYDTKKMHLPYRD